jgi:hypothetical protein
MTQKAVVSLGYREFVLDADKALTLLGLLEDAELYQEKYRSGGINTFHIYQSEEPQTMNLKLLPKKLYDLAKLAGKPEEK